MPADLVQNVPLFRQENDPTYVWRPQAIFPHSEGYNYEYAIDTGQVSDVIKNAMGASDFSRTADQQRRAKYLAFTSREAATVFWNGALPDSKVSQAAANFYLN